MSAVPVYPVRVRGSLDPRLSRWLWLVKWLLAIPHYVVLLFLWIAFVFLTVVAFFAIAFTGRYPRSIFDFNLGVLRWTWRVAFYSYSALGTDHYPPFSLGEEPDYPAVLEVPYPDHLSRGLVWVKSWLLVLPHYLVVGVFVGGGWFAWQSEHWSWTAGGGLVGLLVFLAAVALLFAGRYPRGIFDLVLGLNRWVVRVGAYAALMTDVYPPFRLDLGGDDGGAVAIPEAPAARDSGGGAGKVALLVVGSIFGLVSLGILAGGATAVVYDQTQRDSAGYLSSSFTGYSTGTYALLSERIELDTPGSDAGWDSLLGTVRIESQADHPVFVGIARTTDVASHLGSVRHETARNLFVHTDYRTNGTGAPSTAPGEQSFWVASAEGSGSRQLTWDVRDGDWQVVVMNADGSDNVDASLAIGAQLPNLLWIGIAALAVGGLVLGIAVLLVVLGARRRS
jgi:Domain of unknown function (DUF4389)